MYNFITPPKHINFFAKKLCDDIGEIMDCAIAYLEKGGGGPTINHTHAHNHFLNNKHSVALCC